MPLPELPLDQIRTRRPPDPRAPDGPEWNLIAMSVMVPFVVEATMFRRNFA